MPDQSVLIAGDILPYLKAHEEKGLLRFITCGSVDDGKSTLIGRLLWDSKLIFEDQLAALHKDSASIGNAGESLDLALLTDGLKAEREQGITIDVAYRYFSTAKRKREFAPGSPPVRAAMVTLRESLLHSLPRLESRAAFLCLIVDHLECPDMGS